MKKIALLGILLLLASCKKDNRVVGLVIDVGINLVVVDQAGNDLLAPEADFIGPDSV